MYLNFTVYIKQLGTFNKWIYDSLDGYTSYTFQLNALTEYGSKFSSNILKYQKSEHKLY
jgi:hypothetical protein